MSSLFDTLLVQPILNILLAIYHVLYFVGIPYALGFSIIMLTVVIRFVLYPFTSSQLKASKKMQTITPHLSRIKEKHKGDAKRMQEETMRLYKEHGVNPAAGCLPMLVQLPVIYGLYAVLQEVVKQSSQTLIHINKLAYIDVLRLSKPWDQHFFGVPLGQNPSHLVASMPFILLVPVATGLFQLIQSKMMFSKPVEDASQTNKEKKTTGNKDDSFAAAFQTQSLYVFPAMIGFFSYSFPIGLSLYWNTFTLFGILQQYRLQGLGGLEEWIKRIPLTASKQ